jgi:hypothetical protein
MNFSKISGVAGLNPGADSAKIAAAEVAVGAVFPVNYKELVTYADGGLLDDGVSIYSMEDLPERNETYEIKECCDGYLLIGDDSGGRGFLIDLNSEDSCVYGSGFGDLDPADFVIVAASLQEWVDSEFSV